MDQIDLRNHLETIGFYRMTFIQQKHAREGMRGKNMDIWGFVENIYDRHLVLKVWNNFEDIFNNRPAQESIKIEFTNNYRDAMSLLNRSQCVSFNIIIEAVQKDHFVIGHCISIDVEEGVKFKSFYDEKSKNKHLEEKKREEDKQQRYWDERKKEEQENINKNKRKGRIMLIGLASSLLIIFIFFVVSGASVVASAIIIVIIFFLLGMTGLYDDILDNLGGGRKKY